MKQDKNIDDFSKDLLKDVGLETPSANFVNNVLKTINVENTLVSNSVYKPLISKRGWFFIVVCLIVLFTYFYTSNTESSIPLKNCSITTISPSSFSASSKRPPSS